MSIYRLYSWEHSYFSGKVRAYLRFKANQNSLGPGFEDILATPELIAGLLTARSGSGAVPQVESPDGTWLQDSSEIIDSCEKAHPEFTVVPDVETAPKQRFASYLIEFLADEWLVVPAFWQRWFFTERQREPSHRVFNAQQWGAALAPDARGEARQAAGTGFFEAAFGLSDTRQNPKGVYEGLVDLGCDARTERAWQASQHAILEKLELHFERHDYLLGGRPSLGDYGLLGPLYAHLYRDAVPGFYMRTHFPLVCEWVERTNGEGALNARQFGQRLYSLDKNGALIGRPATSDGGAWLPNDEIPETLLPVLQTFFDEMWPVLANAAQGLRSFVESEAHALGDELPGKSFTATPEFRELQQGEGPLTHSFEIGGVGARRMILPYQMWMWQRLAGANAGQGEVLTPFIESLCEGTRTTEATGLLEPSRLLGNLQIEKRGGRLYSAVAR